MKRTILALLFGLLALSCFITIVLASENHGSIANLLYDYKQFKGKYTDQPSNVILTVNRESVTEKDLEFAALLLKYRLNNTPARDDIIAYVVEKKVLRQEAIKRGLMPSRDETLERMSLIRKQIQEVKNPQSLELMEALEVNKDDFWTSEKTITAYQNAFAIANLRDQIRKEFLQKNNHLIDPGQVNRAFDEHFAAYTKALLNNAKIEYTANPSP